MKTLAMNVRRLAHIARVLVAHGLAHLVVRVAGGGSWLANRVALARLTGPQRFRRLFEDLGGSFVKFGQMLALQPDIVSLGADGQPGGEGDNADIVSWNNK